MHPFCVSCLINFKPSWGTVGPNCVGGIEDDVEKGDPQKNFPLKKVMKHVGT